MPDTLIFILVIILIGIGLISANVVKQHIIRSTGTRVTAKVIQVRCWQEVPVKDFSLHSLPVLLPQEKWQYELIAEWTDPQTEETYTFTSRIKKGLPRHRRGDFLTAYISSRGNYLELS